MSTKIVIKTTDRVVPMIYAYTTPEIARHNGWTKIGYTEQDVDKRLSQQTHTADVEYKEEWRGNATFEDGSGDTFTDKDFHRYLRKLNIENDPKNEWFHVTGPVSRNHFYDFRANRGILQTLTAATPYNLREEQEDAVEKTLDYSRLHTQGEYLWNAKPRFGKTLTAYELCKQMDADTVLIVTNCPAIANSWYSDYEKFLGPDSGYLFVSDTSSLQGKPFVVSRNQYLDMLNNGDYKCIEFVSLQDLKGSIYFGGEFEKLKEVNDIHWDVLIIDEAHEGVDTYKTDVAFDHIDRNFTLHLSGTPFKAIASEKFKEDAIYNWTYADEQKKKRDWQGDQSEQNLYANLPQLNMFTYQMSEVVSWDKAGLEIYGVKPQDIDTVKLHIDVYDEAEWDVSNRDDPVDDDFVIYPKGEENATEPKHEIQPTDIVLFDNNACSMVICGFYSDSFMGYTAKAYCQNKTDDRIDVILDKGSINGFECTPEGAALLEPHSNAYVDIRWQEYAETYAENGNDPTSITEIVMPVFVRKDTGNNTVYIDATYSIDPQARAATPIVNPQ